MSEPALQPTFKKQSPIKSVYYAFYDFYPEQLREANAPCSRWPAASGRQRWGRPWWWWWFARRPRSRRPPSAWRRPGRSSSCWTLFCFFRWGSKCLFLRIRGDRPPRISHLSTKLVSPPRVVMVGLPLVENLKEGYVHMHTQ